MPRSIRIRNVSGRWGRAASAALLVFIAVPDVRAADAPTIQQFVKIRWPRSGSLAPDGSLYYMHNPEGTYQLYRDPTPAAGRLGDSTNASGDARKLTDFPDGISGYTLSDDGKTIVVSAAVGGNEQTDLYLLDTRSSRLQALLAHPDVVYGSVVWRRDSRAFAFRANDVSPSDFYVYVYDLETNATTRVLDQKGHNTPVDFSSDGSRLMALRYNSASHSQLFELDLTSKDVREITPRDEAWAFEPIGYTAGDKTFLATSNYQGDKAAVVEIDLATGAIRHPFPRWSDYEMDFGTFSPDRKTLALAVNEDGFRTMHLYAMPDRREIDGPPMPRGIVGNVQFRGDSMLYSVDNANNPGVIYRWSPTSADAPPVALTEVDDQGIDLAKFPLPKLVRYKSFDGLEIPAFLYLPADARAGTKLPFVVSYHGGPESQFRPYFNAIYLYFLSRGFGILAPNVRGSSGYGMKYMEMDNYKNRMKSVKDGVAAARWLVDQGYSTPSQIAAYGGSYGGFMVMACITEAPDLYGAACNIVGICNMQTFLERTKDYRRHLREAEYGPLSDPDFLRSVSPIYRVDRIQCPLLIAHGANDPRVPLHEAEQLYDKMKKLDKTVELLVFPDEGHGFRKEKNRMTFAERVSDFFAKHLKPAA